MSIETNKNGYMDLARGGCLVDTPEGYIQFGSPPETVKDTMVFEKGVPQYFVLPEKFFSWIKGISVAEVEFPIYYNFFLKKRKTTIICHKERYDRFLKVLAESVFGPKKFNLREDYSDLVPDEDIPAIQNELAFFRGPINLEDLVQNIPFENNKASVGSVDIAIEGNDFKVNCDGRTLATVPTILTYKPKYDIGKRLLEPFHPPLFGVTCLGPSHGFDPKENTSGFIIWINRRGVMVDPPVNSTEWLINSNVNPKFIDSIILTHCHADHDAGTLQKILEEGKVTIYTTKTIVKSFLRKYSTLTNVSTQYMAKLFNYVPVEIGEPVFIHCGKFRFFYSLHSIPTIGFQLEVGGKTFVYSSDHNGSPELHKKLLDEGVITKKRFDELSNFPWDNDVIYHEAGIPPLHTPIAWLNSLPKKLQKKIFVYHIAKKDFPEKTDLTLATFGIEHNLNIEVKAPKFEKTYHILGILNHLDFFEEIPIRKAQEFLSIVEKEEFSKGTKIIKKGSFGDKFFIIGSGNVSVTGSDLKRRKIYGAFDYFGEAALVMNKKRAADVVAETDVVAYTIDKDKFLHFIKGTELESTLKRLARVRDAETWNVLSTSQFLGILTSTQKTFLESRFHKVEIEKPTTIVESGQKFDRVFIIREGHVEVRENEHVLGTISRGDLIGSMVKVHRGEEAEFSFVSTGPVSLYSIDKDDILKFLDKNPGLIMKLVYDYNRL